MRSTRASAAWSAVAVATSLLSVTIVGAQTQTAAVATSGIAVVNGANDNNVNDATSTLFHTVRRGQPAALPGATAPLTGGVFDIAVVPRP